MDRGDRRMNGPEVLARMHAMLDRWAATDDRRDVFLRCYSMMTANMHAAIARGEFADGVWVDRLLRRFAGYYFDALEQWETRPDTAPRVWQLAHESTRRDAAAVLQHLLLGVNAHINYDLVLTVHELLEREWQAMPPSVRGARYADYCRVNAIIAATIDAVQDDVIAPAMPVGAVLDRLLGRIDEYLISRLITSWRERTWEFAVLMLDAGDGEGRAVVVADVEAQALRIAGRINLGRD